MSRFLEFIEKYKFGILATLFSYILMFMYFQMETYQRTYPIEAWDEKASLEKEEIEIKPENIDQTPVDLKSGEVKSIAQDANDTRNQAEENWDRNKSSKSAEQRIKDLEKQFYAESGESEKRDKIKKELADLKNNQKSDSKTKNEQIVSGGNTAYSGNVMVRWDLSGREPHQGNEWYVRNPGYTCGYGSNGVVTIRIKVNQAGNVSTATYVAEQSNNASSCMVEQARKYALMSRFSYNSQAEKIQEGKIVYTFLAQ